jgi:hypothetical protein
VLCVPAGEKVQSHVVAGPAGAEFVAAGGEFADKVGEAAVEGIASGFDAERVGCLVGDGVPVDEEFLRAIDTAASYDHEREVGEGIVRSGVDRAEVFVTTKPWISDYGYEAALRGFDASLRRLGLESHLSEEGPELSRQRRLAGPYPTATEP